ncbi:MAG TPA: low specificity L-threonine aldolase [Solirubrobacteraceae bacterium]|nr:low specificity L-threonine aldolase [Solirubrobacteraceae bacterium]
MSLNAARGFASDNSATIHPDVLAAIARVNVGHTFGYGHDDYTLSVEARVASAFGEHASAFFVFNGTGANVLSLRAACRRFEAVICAETAHLNVDECGAPEVIAGVKLLTVPGIDGKLTPELVESRIARVGDEHAVQPHLVSISQCTELGTLYTVSEVRELADVAHSHDMLLHVDGARLSNAAAALGVPLRDAAAGADVVSFGGTKNGLLGAEAVVLTAPELAQDFLYVRKQSMQLASKMRFLAAQFDALLSEELWLRCARHANTMAARLADAVSDVPMVQITRPVQANAVFAILPPAVIPSLQREYPFYVWDEAAGEVRWMCSWDTTEEDVEGFATAVRDAVATYA